MKQLFKILIIILFSAFNIYSAWFTQNSGTNVALNSIHFINPNTGYIAGNNGVILKTIDKGANWLTLNSTAQQNLTSVFFLNENTGYIAGDSIILRTANAGNTWIPYTVNYLVKSVYFVNAQLGFAAGYGGVVLKTINGGENWSAAIPISQHANYTSVYFINANTGYIVGLSGRYNKTTNGGLGWEQKPINYAKNFYSIQFLNETTGYVAGGWIDGVVMKSEDEGELWSHLFEMYAAVRFFSSSFIDVNNGLVAGRQGMIMRTEDAGNTWIEENSGTNAILYDIQYLNQQTAYAVGENGKILSTISVIGINQIGTSVPDKFSLSQNYPNPFNPTTHFEFRIADFGLVNLTVYDALGREVVSLVDEALKPGTYEADFDASNLPSGTYFYRLVVNTPRPDESGHPSQEGNYTETKKMVLLK